MISKKQSHKKKPKKSKLQKRKDDPYSGYWLNKCDSIFRSHMHEIWKAEGIYNCLVGMSGEGAKCKGKIECAHLIPVENYLYRWLIDNTIPLCSNHHRFDRLLSCHSSPVAFGIWLQTYYPDKALFVQENKNIITRKIELPWTFKEKYTELIEWTKNT